MVPLLHVGSFPRVRTPLACGTGRRPIDQAVGIGKLELERGSRIVAPCRRTRTAHRRCSLLAPAPAAGVLPDDVLRGLASLPEGSVPAHFLIFSNCFIVF